MKTYKFHVNGMHCNSCVVLTESELNELQEVSRVRASLSDTSVE
jgi:copper chaperone CopZ